MNILIIAAHPDDEILGMGGTILKHTSNKDNVTIVYMATGITARRSTTEIKSNEDKKLQNEILELRKDALKAAKLLKVKDIKFYDFPDNQMDSITLLNVVKAIEKEIKAHSWAWMETGHVPRKVCHADKLTIDTRTVNSLQKIQPNCAT